MIQIKKNEKPLGAQESHGEETEKWIRAKNEIKSVPDHGGRSQIVSRKDVGLPGWMRMKPIGPSG